MPYNILLFLIHFKPNFILFHVFHGFVHLCCFYNSVTLYLTLTISDITVIFMLHNDKSIKLIKGTSAPVSKHFDAILYKQKSLLASPSC